MGYKPKFFEGLKVEIEMHSLCVNMSMLEVIG